MGLALRLHRAALIGWTGSLVLLGAVYGSLGDAVETLFADNEAAQAFFPGASSAGLVEAYFATIFAFQALLAAAYAVSSVLRARAEEAAGRAEPVLATATSRSAWLGSHVTVALVGFGAPGRAPRAPAPRWSGRCRPATSVRSAGCSPRRWPTCPPSGSSPGSP